MILHFSKCFNYHVLSCQKDLQSDSVKNELNAWRSYSQVSQYCKQMSSQVTEFMCKSWIKHTWCLWFWTPASASLQRGWGILISSCRCLCRFSFACVLQVNEAIIPQSFGGRGNSSLKIEIASVLHVAYKLQTTYNLIMKVLCTRVFLRCAVGQLYLWI